MSNLQSLANYIYNNEAYNWKGCHVALCESLRDRVHNREFCVLLSIVCEAQESHKKRVNLFFSEMYKSPLFYSRTRNLAGLYSSVFSNSDLFTYMSIRLLKIAQIKNQLSRLVSRAVLPKRPNKCFFYETVFFKFY